MPFTELIVDLDEEIFLWINSFHSKSIDMFMFWISTRIIWVPLYLTMLYAVFLSYGWRTMLLMGIMVGIAVAASDQVSASVLRPIFERYRPANLEDDLSPLVHIVDGYRGGKYGFPSCHAANTFAAATLTSRLFKRHVFSIFVFMWAILICYSRIYLGVHFPGDLILGALIGSFFGTFCYAMAQVALRIVYKNSHADIRRRMIATYRRGSQMIVSRVFNHEIRWRPTYIPITTGILTLIITFIATVRF